MWSCVGNRKNRVAGHEGTLKNGSGSMVAILEMLTETYLPSTEEAYAETRKEGGERARRKELTHDKQTYPKKPRDQSTNPVSPQQRMVCPQESQAFRGPLPTTSLVQTDGLRWQLTPQKPANTHRAVYGLSRDPNPKTRYEYSQAPDINPAFTQKENIVDIVVAEVLTNTWETQHCRRILRCYCTQIR